MTQHALPTLTAIVVAIVAAVAATQWRPAQADAPTPAPATVHVGPNQLRYPPGSPQLAYLTIQTVKAEVPPLLDPLPARIAFDEDHTVRIFTPVSGRTARILAQPGQTVHAGDVLAWLDAPDYDNAVADVRKAQADQDSKQAARVRAERLHEAGVIATRDLEGAQADARTAQAELARSQARLRSLGGAGQRDADGRFALRAPIDGVIAERHLNPGQEVRADAADPAFVITDPAHLDVVADVAESDIAQLHTGQTVRIETDGGVLPNLEGRISVVGVTMDPANRRVPVRAHLLHPPAGARPDMFVRLAPLADNGQPVAVVPNSALVTSGVHTFVFVEKSPGLLVKTRVELARRGRDVSHIREGLQAGMRVVTKGAALLDDELSTDN